MRAGGLFRVRLRGWSDAISLSRLTIARVEGGYIMRGALHEGVPPAPSMRGVRIGVPRGYLFDRVHEEVEARVLEAIERLGHAGAYVVDVEIPHVTDTVPVYLALVLADAA